MRLLILALLATLSLTSVGAAPITYTITGDMDGSILPTSCPTCLAVIFTGRAFTFVFNGDTSGIFDLTSTVLGNPVLSSSLTIAGEGSGSFTESLDVADSPTSGVAGFTDPTLTNAIVVSNAALVGWGLATTIGPVSNTGLFLLSTEHFDTSLGTLTDLDAYNLTFSASLDTPEPATGGMVGIMVIAAVGLRRHIAGRLGNGPDLRSHSC